MNRYPRFAVGMGPLWEELYAKADEVTLEAFKKRLVEGPRPNERVDVTGPAANELQRSVETDSAPEFYLNGNPSPYFRDAALAALCALATKAEAMRALGIDPEGVGAARLLDNDELALLASLETGIAVAGERSGKRLRFEEVLSSENPVTQHLRRRLR